MYQLTCEDTKKNSQNTNNKIEHCDVIGCLATELAVRMLKTVLYNDLYIKTCPNVSTKPPPPPKKKEGKDLPLYTQEKPLS